MAFTYNPDSSDIRRNMPSISKYSEALDEHKNELFLDPDEFSPEFGDAFPSEDERKEAEMRQYA
jgi:hypothetical protein